MADLEALKNQIREHEARNDLRGITKLRAQIARDFPGTSDAAESLFRMGLYFLFVESNVPAAMQTFEEAIKTKDKQWSLAARVSLASLYLREEKPQKALLELRKAIGNDETPSVHTLSALSIMELVLEREEKHGEVKEVKEKKLEHYAQLSEVARRDRDDFSLAFFLLGWGEELVSLHRPGDAKPLADEALAMGPERSGKALHTRAQALRKTLGA